MKVMLATLCLNEMQWLPRLYQQHKDWPDLVSWVFVESADQVFAATNPDSVSAEGLSTDGTTRFLDDLARTPPIVHVAQGFSAHADPAQGKCAARQRYLDVAEAVKPDLIVVLDADEFYTHQDQQRINAIFQTMPPSCRSFRLKQRDIWLPPSLPQDYLFRFEVVGGYWAVPHTRFWRWEPGLRYQNNHNWPQDTRGRSLTQSSLLLDVVRPLHWNRYAMRLKFPRSEIPQCIHLGFASDLKRRQAKHRYYEARGEGVTDRRHMYVQCRKAFETWQPGDVLPYGARVVNYGGPIPEVFREPYHESRRDGGPAELQTSAEHAADHSGLEKSDGGTEARGGGG